MKELDKKVHRQLATSGGSAIEATVPPLNVVVGANGMFEYCPVCWAPSGSMNPRAGYILSELQEWLRSFLLKFLEHWLYFRFWEKGQGCTSHGHCGMQFEGRGPAPGKQSEKKERIHKYMRIIMYTLGSLHIFALSTCVPLLLH